MYRSVPPASPSGTSRPFHLLSGQLLAFPSRFDCHWGLGIGIVPRPPPPRVNARATRRIVFDRPPPTPPSNGDLTLPRQKPGAQITPFSHRISNPSGLILLMFSRKRVILGLESGFSAFCPGIPVVPKKATLFCIGRFRGICISPMAMRASPTYAVAEIDIEQSVVSTALRDHIGHVGKYSRIAIARRRRVPGPDLVDWSRLDADRACVECCFGRLRRGVLDSP